MKAVSAHAANMRGMGDPVAVVISITEELPGDSIEREALAESEAVFRLDAAKIEAALYAALPGGTYDQLLIEFLSRRRSQLRVSHQWPSRATPLRNTRI